MAPTSMCTLPPQIEMPCVITIVPSPPVPLLYATSISSFFTSKVAGKGL